MNIVLIGPVYPYRGGIAHYTARLAEELSNRHPVGVLSFRRQFPGWLYPGQSDRDPSQQPLQVPASYLLEPLNPLSWLRAAGWIRRRRPDLVIFQWWVTFWSPAFATVAGLCRRAGIPVVFIIHNVLPHEGGRVHRPLARLALGRGDHFIVHTPQECQRLRDLFPGAPATVCPFPAYDMLARQEMPSKRDARQQLSLPLEARVLLFFGIVRPYKGLRVLLEALARLHRQGERFDLLVVGEFWEDKAAYLAQIEALGLADQVRIEDRYIPNEELPRFFAAADLAVAPYTGGTQSAVAALALGFGTPLVATERSAAGLSPAERDGVRIVPPGDPDSLAAAIRAAFSSNSYTPQPERHPLTTGGWEAVAQTVEEVYTKVKGPYA